MSFSVLVVEDDVNTRLNYRDFLSSRGYEVIEADTYALGKEYVDRGEGDIIILDVGLPDGYGPNLLNEPARIQNRIPVIIITGVAEIEMAVEAMRNGAHDFLQKPITQFAELERSIQRAAEIIATRRELYHLRQSQMSGANEIIGKSPLLKDVLDLSRKASERQASVIITGKTGTGKEVIAKFIHQVGPRSKCSFIPLNCAALPPNMLESELFGHEKGAFTDAVSKKLGFMDTADKGILFLDEIASMPMELQGKLLRAIETNSFYRLGGTNLIKVDVQIIAASNRDLLQMVEQEKFREDLYYRLAVINIHLPLLKERKEDIPDLVGFFINKLNRLKGINVTDISPQALQALIDYDWPGNIRQLSNALEHAMIFCEEGVIDLAHLPKDVLIPRSVASKN